MGGGWEVSRGEVCHGRGVGVSSRVISHGKGVGGQQPGDMPLKQNKIREKKDNQITIKKKGCKQILP